MAAATHFQTVQKIYIAFYQRPADPAGLKYWADRIDVAGGDASAVVAAFATSPEAVALYGTIDATTIGSVVDKIYMALFNKAPDAAGKQFYVDGFNAGTFTPGTIALNILNGATGDDAVAINNKAQVANSFTQQVDGRALNDVSFGTGSSFNATYQGDADATAARDILKNVTSSPATVLNQSQVTEEIKTKIADATDPIMGQTGGQTFTLTIGEDRFTGGAGNDTFNALAVEQQGATGSKATLENFDILNGGEGTDTLNATLTDAGAAPVLQSIEVVNARFAGAQTLNLTSATGVQSINVQTSTLAGTVDGVGAAANLAVKNQLVGATFDKSTAATLNLGVDTVGVATAANVVVDLAATVAAKATTLNITANNAFAKVDSTNADIASTVTIAATGTNRLNLVDLGASAKSVTITGAGSVDLLGDAVEAGTALTGALATFNASASTGAVRADIQSTVLATVTTGTGNDWIKMDTAGKVIAGTTVNLGAGTDTLLTGALLGSFAKVDGGEGTDTINITDGSTLDAANAKLINNFEVLDVSGGQKDYDVSLNSFATVQIDEAVNGVLAGAVKFINAADSFTLNVASKAKDGDFATGFGTTVTGKDYAGTTALGTAETFTLVANMRDGNKDDKADGNINANTITVAGVEQLVVEAGVSTLDGGTKAQSAALYTVTAKFVATEAETITIKGAGSVNLAGATTIGVVTKVDATASTGNVTINLSTHAKSVAYFGSQGIDTLNTGTKGDNIYTGKGADIVTLTTAGVRDTFVLKAATDSQIGDNDKSGKITLTGDEAKGGVQMIDTITGFTAGGTAASDRLDVTNFAFSGAQRGVVDVNTKVLGATDLTSIADLFEAPAGDRGLAFSNLGGADLYVFVDANKDGNFTAADDAVIKLVGLGAAGLSEIDVNF